MTFGTVAAEFADRREVVIPAAGADIAVGAQTGRVDVPGGDAGAGCLLKAEEIGLQGDDLRPATPVADGGVEPLTVARFIPLVGQALERLHGEQVELPVIALLTELQAQALEVVGGVAPLVVAKQAAVEVFERQATRAQAQRPGVAAGVAAEQVGEVQLGPELDEFELVDVAAVAGEAAAIAACVLKFDPEPKRIELFAHAKEGAGAHQMRVVEAGDVAAQVVVAVLVAPAEIQAGIEPVEAAPGRIDGRQRLGVLGRIGVGLGAVAAGRPEIAFRPRGTAGEGDEQQEGEAEAGGR